MVKKWMYGEEGVGVRGRVGKRKVGGVEVVGELGG